MGKSAVPADFATFVSPRIETSALCFSCGLPISAVKNWHRSDEKTAETQSAKQNLQSGCRCCKATTHTRSVGAIAKSKVRNFKTCASGEFGSLSCELW